MLAIAAVLTAGCAFALPPTAAPDRDENVWEMKPPTLAAAPAPGFSGRLAGLERITAENAVGDTSVRTFKAAAWRNERVNGQFVVWSAAGEKQLRLETGRLVSDTGAIPASAVRARFVRYVRGEVDSPDAKVPEGFWGDCLDDASSTDRGWLDLPKNGFRPVWLTVTVPRDTAPGVYRGELAVRAAGNRRLVFPIELTVRAETLAAPKDWKFFLDLWQHPWAVARYHGVKPFSDEHFRLLEPLMRELASAGQKTITTTITDLPWNHQCFDAYRTMVEHVKNADGSWTHDYSIFDKWVAFAETCGLGPQIHCYTMASWGNIVYYVDGATGDRVAVELKAGTPEHEAFWGSFLGDFSRHLAAKGWLGRTYIALDERSRAELMASAACVRKYAPGIRIAMAGDLPPSTFKGIEIDNYSSALGRLTPEFLGEVKDRRAHGQVTTFYICCGPVQPNTFIHSPLAEARWLALYVAAKDLDGMLRWSVWDWTREPLLDSSFPGHHGTGHWRPGDTYLLYPNARTSVRWEVFRDSIENFEKIRQLRAAGRATKELESALAALAFDPKVTDRPASAWEADCLRIEGLIDAASAAGGTAQAGCGLTCTRTALWPGFDGKYCKMSPAVATDGKGLAFMTYGMLLLTGCDVFHGSYISKSADGGTTWSAPRAVTEFPDTREHGLRIARSCNPCYNRTRDLWFGLGLAMSYENDRVPCLRVIGGRPYGWPLFAPFDPKTGKFSEPVKIDFSLPYARAYPFGQMVELDDGDMLVPFIYEPLELARNANDGYTVMGRVVVVRCRVGRDGFRIVQTGKPIACDGLRRGVCEPSLVRLGKTFYLTLRSDEYGMWCASADGLNFSAPKRWVWTDDGKEIGNRNTQQHWMKAGERLYLAYTRVTPTNGHVFRNRAPIFLAAFDPARGGLVRETEQPLVPERGARLGNFCCTEDGHGGSWLVTAEWMQPIGCEKYGSDNSIWLVRVSAPNATR